MEHKYLLGMRLKEVEQILYDNNIEYEIELISGKKDQEILTEKRVVNIKKESDKLKLIVSYFSPIL